MKCWSRVQLKLKEYFLSNATAGNRTEPYVRPDNGKNSKKDVNNSKPCLHNKGKKFAGHANTIEIYHRNVVRNYVNNGETCRQKNDSCRKIK